MSTIKETRLEITIIRQSAESGSQLKAVCRKAVNALSKCERDIEKMKYKIHLLEKELSEYKS